jgi:uncharacterized membrane protein
MGLFHVLKFIHIFAAITAVGMNISYGIWLGRAGSDLARNTFALKTIKFVDDRIANPAYGLLLITGLLMVFTLPVPITTLWIEIALVLYVLLMGVGIGIYSPTLRHQVRLAEAGDVTSAEFASLSSRGLVLGIVLGVLAFLILVMMVFKPHLS